eukprot:IDg17847t1
MSSTHGGMMRGYGPFDLPIVGIQKDGLNRWSNSIRVLLKISIFPGIQCPNRKTHLGKPRGKFGILDAGAMRYTLSMSSVRPNYGQITVSGDGGVSSSWPYFPCDIERVPYEMGSQCCFELLAAAFHLEDTGCLWRLSLALLQAVESID